MAALAINPTSLLILGGLLAVVGLVLALVGRKVWTPFMSFVGAVAGGTVGYLVGAYYAPSNYFAALVLGVIGSILGSILFNYLVKIALALITGAIPAALVFFSLPGAPPVADQTAQDTRVIVAILVLLVFFAIAYYFVEELIGVVTALVGGFFLGIGVFLVGLSQGMDVGAIGTSALAAGGLVFLVGATLQTLAIRAAKKGSVWRLRRARAATAAPAPSYAPPSPPPAQAPPASPPRNSPPPPPPP